MNDSLEARLQTTLNVIPAHTWYATPAGALIFVNERCADYLGLPKDHPLRFGVEAGATRDSHIELLHPDDHEERRRVLSTCLTTGSAGEVSFRVRNPQGTYRWFLSRTEPLRAKNGTLLYWIGIDVDIEERKQAELYLAEGQRLAHTGSWAFNAAGFEYWSSELFEIHGLKPGSKAPTIPEYMALVHPEDREFVAQEIQKMLANPSGFDFTKRIVRPDGAIRHVRCVGMPAINGRTGFVGTGMDVTEHELLTEELRQKEAYLAEAQRLSHTGSWAWSPDNDVRYWSEECYRVLGFDPRDGLPRFEDFFQRIHPDDQPGIREQIQTIQTAIREKSEWEADYRIVHPDGLVRDIHVVSHPVLNASGHLVEFVGTVIDVTERKRAEEELRRSEMELRQILDLTPQMLVVLGPQRERLYANRTTLAYLGVSLDDWRRGTIESTVHPDDVERLEMYSDRALSNGVAYELEVRLCKYDRSYRWFLARNSPLHDEQGQVIRWYIASSDIDDRKRAEERLQQENVALREEIDKTSMFEAIVGTSPALTTVLSRVTKVAATDSTVLITGETGTGKELVARAIHKQSRRSSRAFVAVNCAAIPRELIASELFGHEKGAFTGATQRRLGRFELADGGTIFLDEVGELLPDTQVALLRVLQEREFERVGGTQPLQVDVRVIAATNRDLNAAAASGTFRQDLFYRLNVFPLEMPPLRERREDIPVLVEYFIDRYARKAGKAFRRVNKRTLDRLQSYPWPGNVRELQNVIERSVILGETDEFTVDESWLSAGQAIESRLTLSSSLAAHEKATIEEALRASSGQVGGPSGAAARLGLARSTLESKIRALGINKNRFRPLD